MNLIERLGGYEYLNGFYKRAVAHGFTLTEIKEELLKYRRQHNIFEPDDYIIHDGEFDKAFRDVFGLPIGVVKSLGEVS